MSHLTKTTVARVYSGGIGTGAYVVDLGDGTAGLARAHLAMSHEMKAGGNAVTIGGIL
jgi:hypothetical protein